MEAQVSPSLSQQFVEIMVLLHNNFGRQTQVPLPLNQFGVLCVLMDTQGLTITDISRQLNISKQQMTNIIDKLVSAGYVSKEPDPVDRRRLVITISRKGKKLLEEHMEQFRQRFESHAQNLTRDERQELATILRRYYELINKMFA
ncbi:MarR family winged helix-turn-helix transcriptional regulator [Selenomonas ruminantium]|jgi:DNA-binding MarR family transcriptional regulator|uniref:DNA-binding transcriptional regulator, MarR family n=1 Tax=Selenomonas ruminantium TaxID=971 RepID=A0A1K1PWI4_SELRU|nr:MarR family transcriptional regulator [Selenomonas ruminantium]MBO6203110.1 MarR family transcriptional regulator [Selenomonas sp.]SDZ95558.1 DNA-binding transcriptional regulator, MarR family [Selenomonas ruminantium]SFW51820.1 DNA-binding transcriptional regulator, MarR family [Selenomonas ruminantium]